MDSLLANLFISLQSHIATQVPEIKGIFPELGQSNNYKAAATQWPCLFIDFNTLTFGEMLQQGQQAIGKVQCKLVFPVMIADGSAFIDVATAMNHYEVESKLQQALQGWTNNTIVPLSRTSIDTEDRDDTYRVRTISYSLNFDEYLHVITPVITHPGMEILL